MSDCLKIEMREQLPELLHDRLGASARAALEAHLATCGDCAAELEVLRGVRAAVQGRPIPRIDVSKVVAALPRPRVVTRSKVSMKFWRVAAVLAVVAVGGTSIYTARTVIGPATGDTVAVTAAPDSPTVAASDTPATAVQPVSGNAPGLTASGVTSLADEDLEALIGALDALEAAPAVDPEASVVTRVVPRTEGGS
jgi:anti-sigma factor RsiW